MVIFEECGLLPAQMHKVWHIVVQVRKGNAVFRANWLPDNDFVNVIELVPILVPKIK